MKQLLLILLLSLLSPLLLFPNIILSEGGMTLTGDVGAVGLSRHGIMIGTNRFRYGRSDSGGLLSRLDNPYSVASLLPSFTQPSAYSKIHGAEVSLGTFSLSSFLGERNGMGMTGKGKWGNVGGYFFLKGKDGSLEKESVMKKDKDTVYLTVSVGDEWAEYQALVSYALGGVFSSYGSLSAEGKKLGANISSGTVQSFSSSSVSWRRKMEVRVGTEEVNVTLSCLLGRRPIYANEFRSLCFSRRARMRIGRMVAEVVMEKSFINGREKTTHSLSLAGGWWRVKYSSSGGVSVSVKIGNVGVDFRQGGFETTVIMEKEDLTFIVGSEGKPKAELSIDG